MDFTNCTRKFLKHRFMWNCEHNSIKGKGRERESERELHSMNWKKFTTKEEKLLKSIVRCFRATLEGVVTQCYAIFVASMRISYDADKLNWIIMKNNKTLKLFTLNIETMSGVIFKICAKIFNIMDRRQRALCLAFAYLFVGHT